MGVEVSLAGDGSSSDIREGGKGSGGRLWGVENED